ncbi:MAG: 16S rRNA (adenine(1518)-N(6)/adenine(1519)-N(6))-dimethyltransferase RsmA [Patescibacteria group bacterium]
MYKKKSLGQHFLKNPYYLGLVADAAGIAAGEVVLEIGPGDGALTAVLLERGARVVAVEKDSRLIPVLKEKFTGKNFEVIEQDALGYEPKFKTYKVVGNIPYYITGALFKKFLTAKRQPSTVVFLTQKEVAARIARSKKESILSLSVKAYGEPRYIKTVPRGAFAPPPKVDSGIIKISGISRDNFKNAAHEKRFFELVRAGFGKKRKLLKNNLKKFLGAKAEALGTARAEDIHLAQWLILSE